MDRITSMSHFIEVVKGACFTAAAEKFTLSRAQIRYASGRTFGNTAAKSKG
ncbi:MAG: hypothetical protein QNL62_19550 [Gammaproteobacteria bacterium]|nr:hypothetical protein [Gammaproteobacteria bacterium]